MHQIRRGNMSDHYISLLNIEHFVSIFGSIFNLRFWGSFATNLWKGHSYQLNRTHGWFFIIFLPSLMLFYCFQWTKKSFNENELIFLFISTFSYKNLSNENLYWICACTFTKYWSLNVIELVNEINSFVELIGYYWLFIT